MSSENSASENVCRIGTRGSDLALWQAHTIQGKLKDLGVETVIEIIKTRGDRIDNIPFAELEGKNFFTKELEDAQLAGRVDLAVHSLKDLATEMPPGLTLTAMVGREDPRDVLLARPEAIDQARLDAGDVLPLKSGAKIGTSAARRQAQIRFLRDDLDIVDLRGNVPTRVNRLREGLYDGILLARAGLVRLELKLDDLFVKPLDADEFVPAPAQGMLGIQCRENDAWQKSLDPPGLPRSGPGRGGRTQPSQTIGRRVPVALRHQHPAGGQRVAPGSLSGRIARRTPAFDPGRIRPGHPGFRVLGNDQ